MQKHVAKFNAYEGSCGQDNSRTEKSLSSQQKIFQNVRTWVDSTVKASYVVAYLIAKKSKPFTDGEFIKQCIESMVDTVCPGKKGGISLKSVCFTRL